MQFDTERLIACVAGFAGKRALVIGDVILDEYIYGRAERLSREAPIPVLEYTHRDLIPGGAANPSANIASLGGQPVQIGVIGVDPFGEQLRDALLKRQIDPAGLVIDPHRPTTTKTRIMAQMGLRFPQQIARIDQIERNMISGEVETTVTEMIRKCAAGQHALVASDYMTGLLTPAVVAAIRDTGRGVGALLTADAQGQLDKYAGFDLVKCNADEAARYVRHDLPDDDAFASAGAGIVQKLGLLGGMLITRGSDGLTLVEANGTVTHIRAPHIEDVFDTVGAGDTALAVLTLAHISGATIPESAALANIAAGFVVRKVGNYAPSPAELIGAIQDWNR